MIETDGVYIELRSESPERLAAFYERLAGLKRVVGPGVVLSSPGVTLVIKPNVGDSPEDGDVVFGFRVRDGSDPSALRAAAVQCGAVLLSESKRGGLATFSCQDPDGNPFVIVAMQPSVGVETAPVRSTVPAAVPPAAVAPTAVPGTPAATPAAPPSVSRPPVPHAPSAGNRPTRRDMDRLRDMDRIASMAESIAGLDTAFSEDDPAHVMERMRAKIPVVSEAEMRAREADAEMRAREKQSAVDDMLSQYRAQLQVQPAAPAGNAEAPSPQTAESAPPVDEGPAMKVEDPVLAELEAPHTLGPSAGDAIDESDVIGSEAPRTLGRSSAYDDDDDGSSQ